MISSSGAGFGSIMDYSHQNNENNNFNNNNNNMTSWGGTSRLEDDYTGPIQQRRRHNNNNNNHHHYDDTASSSSVSMNSPITHHHHGSSISGGGSITTKEEEEEELEDELESLASDHTGNSSSADTNNGTINDELARELYQLSIQEREWMLHDIHCVPDIIDDNPDAEQQALEELDAWIVAHHDTEEAAAYRIAERMSPTYVQSRELRLKYLRAVMGYDIERAGPRFLLLFEFKLEYFGQDSLTRQITLEDDMNDDDMACLEAGFLQILPVRDPGERPIFFFNFHALKYATLANAMRAIFYTACSIHEDVDVQKKGCVLVTMGFGSNMQYMGYQFLYAFVKTAKSTSARVSGLHHCMPPGIGGTIVSWFGTLLPQRARIRTRIHVGTYEENMTKLMSHGISTRFLPIADPIHNIDIPDTQWHLEWLEIRKKVEARYKQQQQQQQQQQQKGKKKRQQQQKSKQKMVVADAAVSDNDPTTVSSSSSSASSPLDNNNDYGGDTSDTTSISSNGTSFNTNNNNTIIVPSPKDILMGRGKRTMTSPGNIRLYMMLDDNFERYETAARNLKSSIAKDMVDQVKAKGCRFLEQVDGFWVQVDDTKARNKVSHDFRTLRSSKKSGSNSKEAGGGGDGKTSTKNNNTTKKVNKRGRTN